MAPLRQERVPPVPRPWCQTVASRRSRPGRRGRGRWWFARHRGRGVRSGGGNRQTLRYHCGFGGDTQPPDRDADKHRQPEGSEPEPERRRCGNRRQRRRPVSRRSAAGARHFKGRGPARPETGKAPRAAAAEHGVRTVGASTGAAGLRHGTSVRPPEERKLYGKARLRVGAFRRRRRKRVSRATRAPPDCASARRCRRSSAPRPGRMHHAVDQRAELRRGDRHEVARPHA